MVIKYKPVFPENSARQELSRVHAKTIHTVDCSFSYLLYIMPSPPQKCIYKDIKVAVLYPLCMSFSVITISYCYRLKVWVRDLLLRIKKYIFIRCLHFVPISVICFTVVIHASCFILLFQDEVSRFTHSDSTMAYTIFLTRTKVFSFDKV